MKIFILIFCILIILFKTGNVLSNNNIFNVNNVEINKEISKNEEILVNQAFKKAFEELSKRLLLEKDRLVVSSINLSEIKKLILYYQITNPIKDDRDKIMVNVFFDKDKMHNFFYTRNILYSDIINTDVVLFPLLIKENQYFIYNKNFFYENWNFNKNENLLQYSLPVENIESIQKINLNKNDIFNFNVDEFFKEYESSNKVFVIIDIKNNNAEVILNTRIDGKKIHKSFSISEEINFNQKKFNHKILFEVKKQVRELIKSQNLIDVRTPSFLNVNLKTKNKSNLYEFSNRLKKIDLIDDFYVQQLNKEYVLVKIKFFGKIYKIKKKLKEQNINLEMSNGQWQINII